MSRYPESIWASTPTSTTPTNGQIGRLTSNNEAVLFLNDKWTDVDAETVNNDVVRPTNYKVRPDVLSCLNYDHPIGDFDWRGINISFVSPIFNGGSPRVWIYGSADDRLQFHSDCAPYVPAFYTTRYPRHRAHTQSVNLKKLVRKSIFNHGGAIFPVDADNLAIAGCRIAAIVAANLSGRKAYIDDLKGLKYRDIIVEGETPNPLS